MDRTKNGFFPFACIKYFFIMYSIDLVDNALVLKNTRSWQSLICSSQIRLIYRYADSQTLKVWNCLNSSVRYWTQANTLHVLFILKNVSMHMNSMPCMCALLTDDCGFAVTGQSITVSKVLNWGGNKRKNVQDRLSCIYIPAANHTNVLQNGRIYSLNNTFVIPCSKNLAGRRIRPPHLERELRVVRRLDDDVQHGGQHCSNMQGLVPHNRINIIRRAQNKNHSTCRWLLSISKFVTIVNKIKWNNLSLSHSGSGRPFRNFEYHSSRDTMKTTNNGFGHV